MIHPLALVSAIAALAMGGMTMPAPPGQLQDRVQQYRAESQQRREDATISRLPAGSRVLRDVVYGKDPLERFDVYAPQHAQAAPVILKVARWVPRGFIVVSVDYPMAPEANALQQAQAVARALAAAQRAAPQWGGDPRKFVLMGHSAGAHLVALLAADPPLAAAQGAQPWLGTIALDSAAYDVTSIMRASHNWIYDRAFGKDPALWAAASPTQQLRARIAPFLAVCSMQREDSCPEAQDFVDKARSFGASARVLREDLNHGQINDELGLTSPYTAQVDRFMADLDPGLAQRLDH